MLKRILSVIVASIFFVGIALATSSSESYNYATSVNLSASVSGDEVELTWSIAGGEAPLGFKVVKSRNSNPEYPPREGDSWQYLSSPDARNYTWESIPAGTWHFRVGIYKGGSIATYSNDVQVTIGDDEGEEDDDKIIKPDFHAPAEYKAAWKYQSKPDYYDAKHPTFENQSFKVHRGDKVTVVVGIKNIGKNTLKKGELVIATYKDIKVTSAPLTTGYDSPKHKNFGRSYFQDEDSWHTTYQAATLDRDLAPGQEGELKIILKIPNDAPYGFYREDFSTAIDNYAVNKKWLLNTENGDSWYVLHIWIGIQVVPDVDDEPEPSVEGGEGVIYGTVFWDLNQNGRKDEDEFNVGANSEISIHTQAASSSLNSNGEYFMTLAANHYYDLVLSGPYDCTGLCQVRVAVDSGEARRMNFGLYTTVQPTPEITPIEGEIVLHGQADENTVILEWILDSGVTAPYGFKLVKSLNPNPEYPTREGDYYKYLSSPTIRRYEWDDLPVGTWHFRVGIYDGSGHVTAYSNDIALTVSGEEEEPTPEEYATSVVLEAGAEGNDVELEWLLSGGGAPHGFKLIKSHNPNPEYPTREGDYFTYLSDPDTRSFVWEDLPAGNWHFRVGVYNGAGQIVKYSNDVELEVLD